MLSDEYPDEICADTVIELRDIIEDIARYMSAATVQEFERLNQQRQKQGLRELKRLNVVAVRRASGKVLSSEVDVDMGSQDTGSPGGNQWNKQPPKYAMETR